MQRMPTRREFLIGLISGVTVLPGLLYGGWWWSVVIVELLIGLAFLIWSYRRSPSQTVQTVMNPPVDPAMAIAHWLRARRWAVLVAPVHLLVAAVIAVPLVCFWWVAIREGIPGIPPDRQVLFLSLMAVMSLLMGWTMLLLVRCFLRSGVLFLLLPVVVGVPVLRHAALRHLVLILEDPAATMPELELAVSLLRPEHGREPRLLAAIQQRLDDLDEADEQAGPLRALCFRAMGKLHADRPALHLVPAT
jgi:hypothetical protein